MRKMKFFEERKGGGKLKNKLIGIFITFSLIIPSGVLAGGLPQKTQGNRGYLVGGAKGKKEKKDIKAERRKVTPQKTNIKRQLKVSKEADKSVRGNRGIAPKGYLVGEPEPESVKTKVKRQRGRGGFVNLIDKLKFNKKIRKPYPADQSLEGTKGNYIYGTPPVKKPQPKKGITRHRGIKPNEILPGIVRAMENLRTRPHHSEDREIWGFTFPDMPKKEKRGITRHRGNPVKLIQSFLDGLKKQKVSTTVDK